MLRSRIIAIEPVSRFWWLQCWSVFKIFLSFALKMLVNEQSLALLAVAHDCIACLALQYWFTTWLYTLTSPYNRSHSFGANDTDFFTVFVRDRNCLPFHLVTFVMRNTWRAQVRKNLTEIFGLLIFNGDNSFIFEKRTYLALRLLDECFVAVCKQMHTDGLL